MSCDLIFPMSQESNDDDTAEDRSGVYGEDSDTSLVDTASQTSASPNNLDGGESGWTPYDGKTRRRQSTTSSCESGRHRPTDRDVCASRRAMLAATMPTCDSRRCHKETSGGDAVTSSSLANLDGGRRRNVSGGEAVTSVALANWDGGRRRNETGGEAVTSSALANRDAGRRRNETGCEAVTSSSLGIRGVPGLKKRRLEFNTSTQESMKRFKQMVDQAHADERRRKANSHLNILDVLARGGGSPTNVPWSPVYRRTDTPIPMKFHMTSRRNETPTVKKTGQSPSSECGLSNLSAVQRKFSQKWSPTLSVLTNSQSQQSSGVNTPSTSNGGMARNRANGENDPPGAGPRGTTAGGLVNMDKVVQYVEFIESSALIQKFLRHDYCFRISDNYLLAMVYVYFIRAASEYFTEEQFFAFLYLANDVAEDDEDNKFEILAWSGGENWQRDFPDFYGFRDYLLKRLEFRVLVARKLLCKVMAVCPNSRIWRRDRLEHHSGAIRSYHRSYADEDLFPKGPLRTPLYCSKCVLQLDPRDVPTKIKAKNITRLINDCALVNN